MKVYLLAVAGLFFFHFSFAQVEIVPQIYSQQYITNAVYSHSKKIIATAEYRVNRIEFLDGRTKLKMGSINTEGPVINMAVDSSGNYIVAGTERGIIYIIDATTLTIKRTIDAGIKTGSGYFVILNYLPLLFTDNASFYFTGYIPEPGENAISISEYYVYQYDIAKDVLKKIGKSGSNKPYCFLYDNLKKMVSVLGEKKLITLDVATGDTKSDISTEHLKLSSFGSEYFFLDDSRNGRFGILSSDKKDLFFYSLATAKKLDSVKSVSRFLKLGGDNLLYQATDKKFYTTNIKTKQKKIVTSDSISNHQWCSVMLDFRQGVYGLVTRSGIGTVNLNVSTIVFPEIKGDPLPWGVTPTSQHTLIYATNKNLYEFDYRYVNFKRQIASFSSMVRKTIYIQSQQLLLVNTSVQNASGRFVSDSIFAIDYTSGKVVWKYLVKLGTLNEVAVNYDSTKLLLLSAKASIVELDVATGNEVNQLQVNKTIHGIDYKGEMDGFYAGLTQGNGGKYCIEGIGKNVQNFFYGCFDYNSPIRVFACDNSKKYAAVAYPEDSRFFVFPLNKDSSVKEIKSNARVIKYSSDNKWLAAGTFSGGYIRLYDFPTMEQYFDIKCGVGKVFDIAFSVDSKFLFAMLEDGFISVINIAERKVVTEILLNGSNFLVKDKEGYYTANKMQVNEIGLRYGNRCYPVSNADIKYNRPDIIIRKMGMTDTAVLNAYDKAYQKRLKRMNTDGKQLENITGFPEAIIQNVQFIAPKTKEDKINIPVSFATANSFISSFNILVNDVPLFGIKGIDIATRKLIRLDTTLRISLMNGYNKIEVECINASGIKSTKFQLDITSLKLMPSKTYFIGIGINKFSDAKKNLSWCVKDIRDIAVNLKKKEAGLIVDSLFDEKVTIENIKSLKKQLLKTGINDKVIIAYSGHGLLSNAYDYYLSTYKVNFQKPEENGLLYEELESLLDGIPARRKLLLIDACHSGEVDKEEKLYMSKIADSLGLIKGIIFDEEESLQQVGLLNSFELMKTLFVNMGSSTGAAIISAAAGNQFALERGDLKNGVFTYSILEAMRNNDSIKISKLKKIVGERVEQLTNGMQKPTSRNENISLDWSLY